MQIQFILDQTKLLIFLNRALPSLQGGSLENTLTVPLRKEKL